MNVIASVFIIAGIVNLILFAIYLSKNKKRPPAKVLAGGLIILNCALFCFFMALFFVVTGNL